MEEHRQRMLEAMSIFKHYADMSDKERAAVIDTGLFNEFIAAYMIVALDSIEISAQEIKTAKNALNSVFDDIPAAAAVEKAEQILTGKKGNGEVWGVYEVYTWDDVNYTKKATFSSEQEAITEMEKLKEERARQFKPTPAMPHDPICYTVMSDLQYYLLMRN